MSAPTITLTERGMAIYDYSAEVKGLISPARLTDKEVREIRLHPGRKAAILTAACKRQFNTRNQS